MGALVLLACPDPEPPLLDLPIAVRGHREVALVEDGAPDGGAEPRFLGRGAGAGLCVEVPPDRDTSQWRATLTLDGVPLGDPEAPSGPAARAGSTVCFDGELPDDAGPAELAADTPLPLCGVLTDGFDGSRLRLPCRPVRWSPDSLPLERARESLATLLSERAGRPLPAFLDDLDALARRSRDAGLPSFAVRVELIAVHFLTLEGTPEALAAAEERMDRLPAWVDGEAAGRRGAQAAYGRAEVALSRGRRAPAWTALETAARRYVRIGDGERIGVALQQADLLAGAGATAEGRTRLEEALADCSSGSCPSGLVTVARRQLAWLTLLDPLATGAQLDAAEADLAAGSESLDDGDPLELANQRLNAAHLAVRRGGDPGPLLAEARRALSAPGTGTSWRRFLAGWADLIEGLAALERGDGAAAVARCAPLAASGDADLATWGASCLGSAHRLAGDLESAARAFDEALLRHEERGTDPLDRRLPLGPGQRADDFSRAAGLAVERGEPGRACSLLRRLDRLSDDEAARRRCRELAGEDPDLAAEWRERDRRIEGLLEQLAELDRPGGGDRQRAAEPVRRDLRERLRALQRSGPGCPPPPAAGAEPAPAAGAEALAHFRAVALPDEVLLLECRPGGGALARRTALPRSELLTLLDRLGEALESPGTGDPTWRRAAEPLAAALLPPGLDALPGVTAYSLHGPLQGVPLAALPLPEGGWLADRTTVALVPAGAAGRPIGPAAAEAAPPLFVVDPLGDLAGAGSLAATYRELFPAARLLVGEAADRPGLRRALAGAEFLHVDAHGSFVPAFPELSGLELADGRLSLLELTELPVASRFANLSGCQTGRWPITADSGRYGLGGLLARLGAGWVIASRADLDDDLARDFNAAFYRAIAGGAPPEVAYRRALARAADRHPAASWGALLLLRGAGS